MDAVEPYQIWQTPQGKHKWRAKPADFKWWRLSKPQPRLKFKQRKSWDNLMEFHYNRRLVT